MNIDEMIAAEVQKLIEVATHQEIMAATPFSLADEALWQKFKPHSIDALWHTGTSWRMTVTMAQRTLINQLPPAA